MRIRINWTGRTGDNVPVAGTREIEVNEDLVEFGIQAAVGDQETILKNSTGERARINGFTTCKKED